ncbi:DUF2207 domain-containing protein [Candidatus Micrarchaeota archaeon]|nr:DUF2207 domain-containing protein [Candidatus Micrarchaeota archaeon]
MRISLIFLLLLYSCFAFTIESYENHAAILENGDVLIYEKIIFDLDQQYNEGFRSIRPAEISSLDDIVVTSVLVDGKPSGFRKQMYDGNYEIVWTETRPGTNTVQLNYTLKNKIEIFDDFARICYEHYGANWDASTKQFRATMTLPESSRSKEIHFEIYSEKKGNAYLDDLSIVVELEGVPPGNYVGGCYLFDKGIPGKRIEGSALEILENERELYGSGPVVEPSPSPLFCCVPAFLLSAIFALHAYVKRRKPKYQESILPPSDDNPIVAAVLVNNEILEKNALAAIILDLIRLRIIDIIELHKDAVSTEKQRTILMLKKQETLSAHEQAVVDMIFFEKKEVDLDELAKEFNKVSSKSAAEKHPVSEKFSGFQKSLKALLNSTGSEKLIKSKNNKTGVLVFPAFLFFAGVIFLAPFFFPDDLTELISAAILLIASIIAYLFAALSYIAPTPPKGSEEKFEKWDAFRRGLQSSRIKEYPPSSVAIWDRILVYATAMGLAKKVEKHFPELDDLTRKRMEKMEGIMASSFVFYSSATSLSNLSRHGNRSGFSRSSSGGWSSGGGGGFSGGSSGGGGFR